MDDLMPDPPLQDELPEELPWLLRLLPRADVYLQDEVEVALRPTLTRVSCRKGWRGQRLVEAPGNNAKQYGFGLVDWRDGWFDWRRAPKRSAPPVCAQLRRAVERSQARGRIALVLLVTWAPTRPRARCGCASCWTNCAVNWCWSTPPPMVPKPIVSSGSGERSAAPSRMRITRETLPPLVEDADAWAHTISPTEILRQIGSPFADADPLDDHELSRAA